MDFCCASARPRLQIGGQVCPHPETIEMSWPLRDRLMAKDPDGKGGLAAWNGSRPPFVEADAVQHAAYVARITGSRMYIVHVSSHEALRGRPAPCAVPARASRWKPARITSRTT